MKKLNRELKKLARLQDRAKMEIAFIKGYKPMLFNRESKYEDMYSVKLRMSLNDISTRVTIEGDLYFTNAFLQN